MSMVLDYHIMKLLAVNSFLYGIRSHGSRKALISVCSDKLMDVLARELENRRVLSWLKSVIYPLPYHEVLPPVVIQQFIFGTAWKRQ